MKKQQLKMKQVIETSKGLFALGEDGTVYVYQGGKWGWSNLNMTKMTIKESKDKKKEWENGQI